MFYRFFSFTKTKVELIANLTNNDMGSKMFSRMIQDQKIQVSFIYFKKILTLPNK